jgi:hypothetical protein
MNIGLCLDLEILLPENFGPLIRVDQIICTDHFLSRYVCLGRSDLMLVRAVAWPYQHVYNQKLFREMRHNTGHRSRIAINYHW